MRDTEVLLREHVKDLGRCGDIVTVAAGYARNYLLPRRLAVQANEENKRVISRRRARLEVEEAALIADISQRKEALARVTIKTTEKADDHGHLYGSVGGTRIAELLSGMGFPCKEDQVRLDKPLKAVGEHKVEIHIHGEHSAELTVEISAE